MAYSVEHGKGILYIANILRINWLNYANKIIYQSHMDNLRGLETNHERGMAMIVACLGLKRA